MSQLVETYRGAIYPWHCDHQGHLTVMYYVGFFDHAAWQLIAALGFPRSRLEAERRGFVDVKSTIEYHAEQHAGGLLHIESGVVKIGNTSLTVRHMMRNSDSGALVATMESIMLYFDLEARQKVPLAETDKARLADFALTE